MHGRMNAMERWTEEPAFPAEEWLNSDDPRCVNPVRHSGMSLRDYFAAQALGGIEASQGNNGRYVSTADKIAARAYELADAMPRDAEDA